MRACMHAFIHSFIHSIASYEDRIRSMGNTSLQKLQNRYQYVNMDDNEYIPDVIKEKLATVKKEN